MTDQTDQLIEWIRESGTVSSDARYVLSLPDADLRRREIARLGRVHGEGHAWNVQRAVRENWPAAEARLPDLAIPQHDNPREATMQALRKQDRGGGYAHSSQRR